MYNLKFSRRLYLHTFSSCSCRIILMFSHMMHILIKSNIVVVIVIIAVQRRRVAFTGKTLHL